MNYWCLGKELELLDELMFAHQQELMFEREDSGEEVKMCVYGQVVTMMWPRQAPTTFLPWKFKYQ